MEPKGSLPCSQWPTNGLYSEPHASSLHLPIIISLTSIIMLSSHLCLGLLSGLFPSGFSTKIYYVFLNHPMHQPSYHDSLRNILYMN